MMMKRGIILGVHLALAGRTLPDRVKRTQRHILFSLLSLVSALAPHAWGTGSGSWTYDGSPCNWSDTNRWAGGTMADGAGETGWFTNNITAARTITIDTTPRTLGILNVGDANTTHGFTIAATAPVKLTLNNGGANAQINQTDTSKGDTISTTLALADSVDIANASANLLTLSGPVTNAAPGVRTIANAGAGSGGVTISGIIGTGPGTMAVVQNSGTSLLTLSGANSFTGGLFVKAGTVNGITSANAFGANANLVTIGDSNGSANATLQGGGVLTYLNPIAIASGNSGISCISNTAANSVFSGAVTLYDHDLALVANAHVTLSGGITGKGNLLLYPGSSYIKLYSPGRLNHAGTISVTGAGIGINSSVQITGGVGSNVTEITINATNAPLTISALPVEVNTNGTTLANSNTGGTAVLTVSGGVRGVGDLILKNDSPITDGMALTTTAITNTGRIVNSGSGSGSTLISAAIGTNVTRVVQESGTSVLTLSGANSFTGGLFIKAGTVGALTSPNAFGANTSPVTIGDTTGSADATMLCRYWGNHANPIVVASNNTGVATIITSNNVALTGPVTLNDHDLTLCAGYLPTGAGLTISGGIGGKGQLTLNASSNSAIALSSPVNHSGSITNSGAGTAAVTISAGVGSNVTAITQNSTSSALGIITLPVEVNGGGTTLGNNSPGGAALFTVASGVRGIGDLVLKNNGPVFDGITLLTTPITNWGRIVNSGTGSGNTLISAVIGTNVSGVVQNSASSPLVLTAANLYSGGTTIDSGTLRVANTTGSATGPGAVTVNNGGTLQGTGTMLGAVANNSGGTLSPGLDGTAGGTLTMSNLTWNGGGIFHCEVDDISQDASVAGHYDRLVVNNTLTAVPGGNKLVIVMDSLGQSLAFDTNRNYSLKLITCGTAANLDPADVTLDTNAFLVGGTWSVTNYNKSIWVVYQSSAQAGNNYWIGSGNWSTATNWSLGHAPVAGEAVEFDGRSPANCAANAVSNNLLSITLASGYTGTVTVATNAVAAGMNLTLAGDLVVREGSLVFKGNTTAIGGGTAGNPFGAGYTIQAANVSLFNGGSINLDGQGFGAGSGPGKSTVGGGSYGGKGGSTGTGPTYGSITAPMSLGSGGSNRGGGGALRLIVSGTVTVNGILSAGGVLNTDSQGGGSGGSVFLTTGALTGNGTIRANGSAAPSYGGGSGGGGRVAVVLTNSTDLGTVRLQAFSDYGRLNIANNNGAGGTVYVERQGDLPGHGRLIVDYNDIIPGDRTNCFTLQSGVDAYSYAFSEIILTNGGVYALNTNDTLDITSSGTAIRGDPSDQYDGLYLAGGTLTIPAAFGYTNYYIWLGTTNASFAPATALTVGTNATLRFNTPWTLNGPVTLAAGGSMDHPANTTDEKYKINLTVNGDLDIQSGAQINVDGMGYSANNGPGKTLVAASAASHGGLGGRRASDSSGVPGPTYGSITAPTNCGTGASASGGGVVRLIVSGTTTVNGIISAAGANSATVYCMGSGGSVFLTTGALMGNGTIQANGGQAQWGSGGGGRVAVILTNSMDFGNIKMTAFAGSCGSGPGAAGTVYQETSAQGPGQGRLLMDANNVVTAWNSIGTQISTNMPDTAVGTVIITNKAILIIATNLSLTVNGSWTNAATFYADTNSTVVFAGTNTATIAGSNTFYNMTAGAAGKTIFFQAGKTNIVQKLLVFQSDTTLRSTVDGQSWFLTLATGTGSQLVGRVAVKDSDARPNGGLTIYPGRGSSNLGNNFNWSFPRGGSVIVIR